MKHLLAWVLLQAAAVLPGQAQTGPAASPVPNDYGKAENWLCRPGRQDACTVDLSATVVAPNGKFKVEKWSPGANPPIDCFYVYPTVSNDPSANSDMNPGPEELAVVRVQFARFGSQCRLFAPLYRQVTLTALTARLTGKAMAADPALAYHDVLDAWNYYLEHDNQGRGFVLIGHSQGSGVLTELIRKEIDGKPVGKRLVSAVLAGTSLPVPKGKDVGGAFQNVPLCRSGSQTGCVIAYASFRATVPPPATSFFGRVSGADMVAACVNPAALAGGSGPLHAYLASHANAIFTFSAAPKPWVTPEREIRTPYVSVPGLLTAECVSNDKGSYLAVTVHSNPADPRTDDIVGDVVVNGQVQANWGLHLIDLDLTIGNLIETVARQAKAYAAGSL